MIRTVVREHHWGPAEIGRLFLDGDDYESLAFWSEDVTATYKEIEANRRRK